MLVEFYLNKTVKQSAFCVTSISSQTKIKRLVFKGLELIKLCFLVKDILK